MDYNQLNTNHQISEEKLQSYLNAIGRKFGAETVRAVQKSLLNGHLGEGILSQMSGTPSHEPTLPPDISRREGMRR